MNLGRLAAMAAVAAAAILSGCGKTDGQGAADGATPMTAKSQARRAPDDPRFLRVDQIAEGLSPQVRPQFEQLAAQQRRMAEVSAERANVHPDRLDQLAGMIARNQHALDVEIDRTVQQAEFVARFERGEAGSLSAADMARHRTQLAEMVAKLDGLRHGIRIAASKDETVKDAYARWLGQGKAEPTVAEIAKLLQTEPCLRDRSGAAASSSFLKVRGVALGMTYDEVLRGACEANAQSVKIVGKQEFTSHDYKWETPDANELAQVARRLGKPYLGLLTFCLDCTPAKDRPAYPYDLGASDTLAASFLSNGQVWKVSRAQRFFDRSGPTPENQPRKLGVLLPALKERFGQPSYIFQDSQGVTVGWVYLDRRSPLPLEYWYESDPAKGEMQFQSQGLIYENGRLSAKLLARQKPVASDCIGRAGGGPPITQHSPLSTYLRGHGLTSVTDCGVVVVAHFSKVPNYSDYNSDYSREKVLKPPPVDEAANIYRASLQMIDTAAGGPIEAKERQEIRQAAASDAAEIERKAAAPGGPTFAP